MTFLSHQAVVLPLKMGAPRLVSGTALVLGSMAPDVEYFFRGYPSSTISHTWLGQVTFCLPVTLVLYWLVTWVIAEPAATFLPEGGSFRLRDYRLVGHLPSSLRHWGVVAVSALVGSSSHVLLDAVTTWWFGVPYKALGASTLSVATTLGFWVALGIAALLLMRHIGKHRLLLRWASDRARVGLPSDPAASPACTVERSPRLVPPTPGTAGAFWGWVLLGAITGAVLGAVYRRAGFFMHQPATWVHIWLCSVSGGFIGLVTASLAWHVARFRILNSHGGRQ